MSDLEASDDETIFDDIENKRLAGVLLCFTILTSLLLSSLFFSSIAAIASSIHRPKPLLLLGRMLCSASFFETRRLLEVYWGAPDVKDIYEARRIRERVERASIPVKLFIGLSIAWMVCLGDSVATLDVPDLVACVLLTAEGLYRALFLLNEDSGRAEGGPKFLRLRALKLARV